MQFQISEQQHTWDTDKERVAAMKNYILAALDHILNWVLYGVLLPYDMLIALPSALPYFWVKVALCTSTGLFIPRKII